MALEINDTIPPEMKNIKNSKVKHNLMWWRILDFSYVLRWSLFKNVQMRKNIALLPEIIFGNLKFNKLKKSPCVSLHIDKNDMSLP